MPLHTHSPSSSSCTPRIPLLSMHIELHLLSFAPCFHTFTKLSHDIQMNSPLPLSVHSSLFYVASDSKLCSSVKSVTSLFFFFQIPSLLESISFNILLLYLSEPFVAFQSSWFLFVSFVRIPVGVAWHSADSPRTEGDLIVGMFWWKGTT